MSYIDSYIAKQTKAYTQVAIDEGVLVSPQVEAECDGHDVVSKRDLDTPNTFIEGMMQVWTADLGLTKDRESEIRAIVVREKHVKNRHQSE